MAVLANELTNDPLARGYASMTDAEAAARLNTANRTVNRDKFSGDQASSSRSRRSSEDCCVVRYRY